MSTANTHGCFVELIGKRVVGVLFGALPLGNADLQVGTKTLVLEDGTGFTFSANGSFWPETSMDIRRALEIKARQLQETKRALEEMLKVSQ